MTKTLKGEALTDALQAGFKLEGTVVLGDWVRTRHKYEGRVYKIDHCYEGGDDWLAIQTIPVTPEQRYIPWVHVLVHFGGAVYAPIDTVQVLTEHPTTLENQYTKLYFGENRGPQ